MTQAYKTPLPFRTALLCGALFAALPLTANAQALDSQALAPLTSSQKANAATAQATGGHPHHHHKDSGADAGKGEKSASGKENMSSAGHEGPPANPQPFVDHITGFRRTLFMSVGQHHLVFEAPVGMCFLDQSDYLEGAVLDYINDRFAPSGGQVIATFADCMEIANVQHQFLEDSMASAKSSHPEDIEPDSSLMPKSGGVISWLNPENADNDEQMRLSREEYLDLRAKDYRADVVKANTPQEHEGKVTAASLMSEPGKGSFDDQLHRTKDGISLAFSKDEDVEYQTLHEISVSGTTLLHQLPLEITITFSSKDAPVKDFKSLYTMMDAFLAQQVLMNSKQKLAF
jgi:hypothetical protein